MDQHEAKPFLIDGLRLLPWVHSKRREKDADPNFLDCSKCLARDEQKPLLGCGWISAEGRSRFVQPSAWPESDTGICPGYLIQLPQALQTARMYGWRKDGELANGLCGHPMTPLLRDCLDILAGAVTECECHMLRSAADGNR